MRRSLFFLISIITSIAFANAGKVTVQQALQKAQQVLKGKNLTSGNTKGLSRSDELKESDAFYIFNAENNGGFVIVSSDDRTTEILGFSNKGNIDTDKAYRHSSLCISDRQNLLPYCQQVIQKHRGRYESFYC